jgi:hypothetical protein
LVVIWRVRQGLRAHMTISKTKHKERAIRLQPQLFVSYYTISAMS